MSENQSTAIQTVPAELYRQATDVAGVCKQIVTKTASSIQGKKYIRVEGWMSIATAHGCVAAARDVEELPDGSVRATGEIRRISDGVCLSTAEGYVGADEARWTKGPKYAMRAMAQTRAISRVCRTAFAHVVVLMDADLSTTPYEEVPQDGFTSIKPESSCAGGDKPETEDSAQSRIKAFEAEYEDKKWTGVKIHFGNDKGIPLGKMASEKLTFWLGYKPEPFRGKFAEADLRLRAALNVADREWK